MNTTPRLLIIDNETNIRFTLERALRREGYDLDLAADGTEALRKLARQSYDLLLLDLHLGDVNGLEVLGAARRQDEDVIVIILTGHSSLESAVEALRLGAFDYLFKPTMPDVIRQRVREGLLQRQQVLQRRQIQVQIDLLRQTLHDLEASTPAIHSVDADGRFLHSGPLTIDRHHRVATLNGRLLDLTTTEFNILVCLVEASPQPLMPRQLLKYALGYESDDVEARDTIKWHIHHLRRKIEPDPHQPRYIKTIRYKGYFWSSE
ncbi:MAG: response regulator transcription factor [Anaerolineae bacterium]